MTQLGSELVLMVVMSLWGAWAMRRYAIRHQHLHLQINVPPEVQDAINRLPPNQRPIFNIALPQVFQQMKPPLPGTGPSQGPPPGRTN